MPVVLPLVADGALNMLVFPELAGVAEALEPLASPLPLPLAGLDARVAASALRRSSSSAFCAAAALRSCSSISRLSDSYCLFFSSSSMSAIS